VDFLWREARVIVEYEGDQHRTDRRQWQNDIHRVRLLEGLGWKVIRITASDLSDPHRREELMRTLHDLVG
jgi:very-short-patch-repair endonuclease